MKLASLIDRLDDFINPIAVKELRQAVQSRVVIAALLLFLALQLGCLGLFLLNTEFDRQSDALDFSAGRRVFVFLQFILLGTGMLLVPGYAAGRLAAERTGNNVDLLFISSLSPRAIVAGKFTAALVLALLVFSACTPFMTFTYLLRGLDMPTIFLILGIDLFVVMLGVMWSVFLASIPGTAPIKGVLLLVGLGSLILLFSGTFSMTAMMIEFGLGPVDTWEFWAAVIGALTGMGLTTGLLFTWSVAILSPPSANRALIVRLYSVGYWLVTGATAALITYLAPGAAGEEMAILWLSCNAGLFILQLIIAVNEREVWGPRVARRIPRAGPPRVLAFLFYSGAAGGVAFGLLMLGLTFGIAFVYLELAPGSSFSPLAYRTNDVWEVANVMLVLALYTFCYCLSAVFVRAVLLGDRVRPIFTWLVTLLLAGLGMVLPYLIVYLFFEDAWRFNRPDDLVYVTNPIHTIEIIDNSRFRSATSLFESPQMAVLMLWAGVAMLVNLPWFLRQVGRFRPPEPARGVAVTDAWGAGADDGVAEVVPLLEPLAEAKGESP